MTEAYFVLSVGHQNERAEEEVQRQSDWMPSSLLMGFYLSLCFHLPSAGVIVVTDSDVLWMKVTFVGTGLNSTSV